MSGSQAVMDAAERLSFCTRIADLLVALEQARKERPEKRAPVQGYSAGIPWSMHLRAYDAYSKKWSPQPALIEGWCRGGFAVNELDMFIPGWREELSELAALRAQRDAAQQDAKDARAQITALREALKAAHVGLLSAGRHHDALEARAALEMSGGVK